MAIFKKQNKQETIIYAIVWVLLFLAPLVALIVQHVTNPEWPFFWRDLFATWKMLLVFFIVFVIHNHVLAPMLINERRTTAYVIATALIVGVFTLYQCNHHPEDMPPPNQMEQRDGMQAGPQDKFNGAQQQQGAGEAMRPMPPREGDGRGPMGPPLGGGRPFDVHAIVAFIILIMMLGSNLGIKLYARTLIERSRMARLKEQSLKQELEYLRYQMNPHFFMNTLNNIHALVDIDPNQAKDSIVDLSKMMRYLLYETDKDLVPLINGMNFLSKYIDLMRLRYTDKVTINLNQPDESVAMSIMVPPLVFIPFVENAIKHGVSYTRQSIIDIDTTIKDERIIFHCRNSKNAVEYEYGGVGLTNVRKRLDIIFGSDYSLDIIDNDDIYDVTLNIPAHNATKENNPTTKPSKSYDD